MATTGDGLKLEIQQTEIQLAEQKKQPEAKLEDDTNIYGRGGKREACGFLCASVARSPDAISPSFYVVAILSFAYLDSSCFDKSDATFHGMKWFVG